jgi:hypothetical protein
VAWEERARETNRGKSAPLSALTFPNSRVPGSDRKCKRRDKRRLCTWLVLVDAPKKPVREAEKEVSKVAKVNPVQVQKFPGGGMDYPATKQDIIKKVEQEGADKNIRSTLQQVPDKQYDSPTAVSHEIGEIE